MCIRYVGVDARSERTAERLGVRPRQVLEKTNGLFPGDTGTIVRNADEGDRELVLAKWGLTPFWAKTPNFGKTSAYNARSETVDEKPTFRTAFKKRRCIVPASAFYERQEGRWLKILPTEGELFAIAGLWEPENEKSGADTYTLVTTEPNAVAVEAHDRMPVILPLDALELWLSPEAPVEGLKSLMIPCPPEWIRIEDAGPVASKSSG